jgi:hypothetical protein
MLSSFQTDKPFPTSSEPNHRPASEPQLKVKERGKPYSRLAVMGPSPSGPGNAPLRLCRFIQDFGLLRDFGEGSRLADDKREAERGKE